MKKADKNRLAAHWLDSFPTLVRVGPTILVKRHGPLLVGICLNETSNAMLFRPTFLIHNLAQPFSGISLGLPRVAGPLPHGRDVRTTDADGVSKAIEQLASLLPVLRSPSMTFNDFVRRTRDYMAEQVWIGQDYVLSDLVAVAAYLGLKEYAKEAFEYGCRGRAEWPPRGKQRESDEHWRGRVVDLIDADLHTIVNSEVSKHKLSNLPDLGLDVSETPMRLW